MQSVTSATAVATTARANNITLFASLELSKSKWVRDDQQSGQREVFQAWGRGWRRRLAARPSFAVEGEGRAATACRSKRSSFRKRDWTGFGFIACCSPTGSRAMWSTRLRSRSTGGILGSMSPGTSQDRCYRRRDAVGDADGLTLAASGGSVPWFARRARKTRIAAA